MSTSAYQEKVHLVIGDNFSGGHIHRDLLHLTLALTPFWIPGERKQAAIAGETDVVYLCHPLWYRKPVDLLEVGGDNHNIAWRSRNMQ